MCDYWLFLPSFCHIIMGGYKNITLHLVLWQQAVVNLPSVMFMGDCNPPSCPMITGCCNPPSCPVVMGDCNPPSCPMIPG